MNEVIGSQSCPNCGYIAGMEHDCQYSTDEQEAKSLVWALDTIQVRRLKSGAWAFYNRFGKLYCIGTADDLPRIYEEMPTPVELRSKKVPKEEPKIDPSLLDDLDIIF